MPITRTPLIDDDGSGTTGTILNNAWWTTHYNAIDAALADTSEGVWTPTDQSGAGLTFATAAGGYVKVGPLVFASAQIVWPATANAASALVSLPFIVATPAGWNYPGGVISYTSYTSPITVMCTGGSFYLFTFGGTPLTNAQMSGKDLRLEVIYRWK
jgi:hypothetical protein